MDNIRANRPKPGLSYQHLAAVNAAHQACNAKVEGNVLGSTSLTFIPGPLAKTRMDIDVGTAGSVTLLLQSFLLPALFSGKDFHLKLKGGTDVSWSVPVDYVTKVLFPQLRKYADLELKLVKRGFYPRGGGEVVFSCKGKYPGGIGAHPISLTRRPEVLKVGGLSFASYDLQSSEAAEAQARAATLFLAQDRYPLDLSTSYTLSQSSGCGLVLWALCGGGEGLDPINPVIIGSSALADLHLQPGDVGEEAARALREELACGAPCDRHLADQLIPILGVVGGTLRASVLTDHARSNLYVVERFLGTVFVVDEGSCTISCPPWSGQGS
jgi:RNA 3'-phosphate cyclase